MFIKKNQFRDGSIRKYQFTLHYICGTFEKLKALNLNELARWHGVHDLRGICG